jgi:wobble nucleotide-excising tRNase
LIQQLNLNDWVNEGRTHVKGDNKTCPFCQQETITQDFKKQLEDYFDEAFTHDTKKVKLLADEYLGISQNILQVLQNIESTERSNAESKLDMALFTAYNKILSGQLAANRELLGNKMKEPSRSIQVVSSKEAIANVHTLINNSNEKIRAHNAIVNDYVNQKALLVKAIWKYLAESAKPKIEDYRKKIEKLDKEGAVLEEQRQELLKKYQVLDKKIRGANINVTGVQSSIDEINRILKLHGFLNFGIVPAPKEANQYQIQRQDGTIAEATLSEGEITFITFLYFLQLAKGSTKEETITDDRILVIDDPISNLDSNSLFVVSSLIKGLIKNINEDRGNIRQLILLTHNVYFHKEVSFIDNKMRKTGDYNFYMLRKNDNVTTVQEFGTENPVLNAYELLWRELSAENNSVLTTQNIMRQIIEHYFKIVGKSADEVLLQSFENAREQEICRSLVSRINDSAHSIPDDLYVEHPEELAGKYFEVFKEIFTQMGHQDHYEMMFREQEALVE